MHALNQPNVLINLGQLFFLFFFCFHFVIKRYVQQWLRLTCSFKGTKKNTDFLLFFNAYYVWQHNFLEN